MFAVGSLLIMYSRFVNAVQNLRNITNEMVGSGCSKINPIYIGVLVKVKKYLESLIFDAF
jgi:hypothetical protein